MSGHVAWEHHCSCEHWCCCPWRARGTGLCPVALPWLPPALGSSPEALEVFLTWVRNTPCGQIPVFPDSAPLVQMLPGQSHSFALHACFLTNALLTQTLIFFLCLLSQSSYRIFLLCASERCLFLSAFYAGRGLHLLPG